MSEWKKYKLAEVLTFYNGKEVSVKDEDIFPVYGSNGIIGFNNESCFENAVIIGRVGAYCGSVFYEKNKFWASDNTIVVKEKEEFDIVFIFYLLAFLDLNRFAGGSAQPLLTHSYIKPISLNFPPLPIQQKIAAILSAYDDLIENNLKQIKLLEEMAQITYEEWFVRFKFPNHENTPVDEVTGLPLGWEENSVGNLGKYLNGYAFKPDDLGKNGLPVIKIKEMKSGIDSSTPRNLGHNIPKKYVVERGDIVFSWSASLEVVIWQSESGLLNQHLFVVTPNENISKSFLYLALKNVLPIFDNITTGATMKHIKRQELDFVKIGVPTAQIMKNFDELVEPILATVIRLNHQNQLLKEARDILLPRLMTGKIAV